MNTREVHVFLDGKHFAHLKGTYIGERVFRELAEEAVLYFPEPHLFIKWFRKDMTPMLLEEVPKVYQAHVLLLQ